MPPKKTPPEVRFERHVDRLRGPVASRELGRCHVWTGARNKPHGTGVFSLDGKPTTAHRAAWLLAGRGIPEGHIVGHVCHNPACVRVDHLFLLTRAQLPKHTKSAQEPAVQEPAAQKSAAQKSAARNNTVAQEPEPQEPEAEEPEACPTVDTVEQHADIRHAWEEVEQARREVEQARQEIEEMQKWQGRTVMELRAKVAATLPRPCSRCGKPVLPPHAWDLDHVIPISEGGRVWDLKNLQPAHRYCNRAHGAALVNAKRRSAATRTRPWM